MAWSQFSLPSWDPSWPMLFVVLGFLPGYQAPTLSVFYWRQLVRIFRIGAFFCLTLFFWRRRFSIFLDVICIDQKDETRKAKGIISMGAILKSSDSILVLWDSSYSSRLWCVWEPWMNEACFLKDFQELEVTVVMVQDTWSWKSCNRNALNNGIFPHYFSTYSKVSHPKRKVLFQTSFSRGKFAVKLRGRTYWQVFSKVPLWNSGTGCISS